MFRSALFAGCIVALALTSAMAQQPTQAQRDAIRASCRSDFMANCSSVQPGGKEALECLLRNEARLSAPCRGAVNAIASPASNSVTPAPAAAPSEASSPAAVQPSAPAAAAPPSTKSSRPTTTRKTPATTTAVAPATTAPAATPAVAPLGPIRPMLPRRALMILAECRPDQERLCATVPPGGGKIFECLAANAQQLSPTCYAALARVSE